MDWDEFMKYPGCSYAFHSDVKPERPKDPKQEALNEESRPSLIRVSEAIPTSAPIEVTRSQVPFITSTGLLKCRHAGCQREYDPMINADDACEYHEGSAGFRDTRKFWTCCGASSYDWEEFMRIPKCKTGPHEPKMVDSPS